MATPSAPRVVRTRPSGAWGPSGARASALATATILRMPGRPSPAVAMLTADLFEKQWRRSLAKALLQGRGEEGARDAAERAGPALVASLRLAMKAVGEGGEGNSGARRMRRLLEITALAPVAEGVTQEARVFSDLGFRVPAFGSEDFVEEFVPSKDTKTQSTRAALLLLAYATNEDYSQTATGRLPETLGRNAKDTLLTTGVAFASLHLTGADCHRDQIASVGVRSGLRSEDMAASAGALLASVFD